MISTLDLSINGPRCSRLALGMMRLPEWQMSPQQLVGLIEGCLELGLTTFDHADIYGGDFLSEELFGQALAKKPGLREQMQIVTKCDIVIAPEDQPTAVSYYNTNRDYIISSLEHSLRALRTDYVDLLLIHRPDPLMDADEVARAFVELKEAGKVRYLGVSNFFPWHLDLLRSRLDLPLVTNQVELSVMHMEPLHDGTIDQCQRLRIAPMAWSPLGGGELFLADTSRAINLRHALAFVGQELGGLEIDQVALAWLLTHPARVVPIIGTGKVERIRKMAAAEKVRLSREQWFTIWTASAGMPVP